MKVSVVVPAYNEEAVLASCLSALTRQNYPDPFEVVVVDNGSLDKTAVIALEFKGKLNLQVVAEMRKGRGSARAAGFAKAGGDYVLSTDADCEVPQDWITRLVGELKKQGIVAVTGPCRFSGLPPLKTTWLNAVQPLIMQAYRLIFRHYWLSGFNFGIKREIYMDVGGFNSHLNIQEDVDLSFRVSKIGKIYYLPLAVTASGRRFTNIWSGIGYVYVTTFINYFILRKENIELGDIR